MTPRRWRLGLLGHPVSHSRSPALHHAALASVGLCGTYERFDAPDPLAFERVIDRLRCGTLDGLNVTVPHKERAMRAADSLTEQAKSVGAVNTLWMNDGALVGDNTDAAGLASATAALVSSAESTATWSPERAAVIGAGGAARAAVVAALELGASSVVVTNRTYARAVALADGFDDRVSACRTPETACTGASLVYQATSQGMSLAQDSTAFQTLFDGARVALAQTTLDAVIVDLVYTPPQTPWTLAAAKLDRTYDNGLEMLLGQAAIAFTRWTSAVPNRAEMRAALTASMTEPAP